MMRRPRPARNETAWAMRLAELIILTGILINDIFVITSGAIINRIRILLDYYYYKHIYAHICILSRQAENNHT